MHRTGSLWDTPAGPNTTERGEPSVHCAFEFCEGQVFTPKSKHVFELGGGEAVEPWVGRGSEIFDGGSTGAVHGQLL